MNICFAPRPRRLGFHSSNKFVSVQGFQDPLDRIAEALGVLTYPEMSYHCHFEGEFDKKKGVLTYLECLSFDKIKTTSDVSNKWLRVSTSDERKFLKCPKSTLIKTLILSVTFAEKDEEKDRTDEVT